MLELGVADLDQLATDLARQPRELSDAERIDVIAVLERVKNAACAAQALVEVDVDTAHRATVLVKETDRLDDPDRRHVDQVLCGAREQAAALSTRALEQAARHVSVRPHRATGPRTSANRRTLPSWPTSRSGR